MYKFFICCFLLLLSSCSTTTNQIGVIAPTSTTFSPQQVARATVRKHVSGEDQSNIFLFIPLGFPNFNTAVQRTLKNGNGNVLINAEVVDHVSWYVLFGYQSIRITGDVVNLPATGGISHE